MTGKIVKKQLPGIVHFSIILFQIILYIPIQIIFIPIACFGLADGIYRGIVKTRKLGVSFSACRAFQYKWFMHYFGIRPDPLSVAFLKKFPCDSHFGLWSTFGALIISQRLSGFTSRVGKVDEPGKETFLSFAGPRVLMFDRIMEKHVDEMEQIVLPGAGFDLTALHATTGKDIKVFELDQVNTLNIKVETLQKAGIKHDWIIYIPVDYATESWADKLREAGFDSTKRTLFLWQSVSLFLEADIVRETLKDMAELCREGSVIAQDFYSSAYISGELSKTVKRASRMIEKREPWVFGIEMSNDPKAEIESFLKECGLIMTEYIQFGRKLDIEPYYCIVEAKTKT